MDKSDASVFLDCYQMQIPAPEIVPGQSRRAWMDESPDRFAYRCLPLTMANSTGWDILCPFDIDAEWNGGPLAEDLKLSSPDPSAYVAGFASSHFASGIVTFHTGYLFRTPPGWAVWCMGSPNDVKDGVAPLSGLVETDWLPFPFTMNWKMTRPGIVRFKKGDSFCFLTLSEHNRLDEITPSIRDISANPGLKKDYELWSNSRADFIKKLADNEPETVKAGWQRKYMQGQVDPESTLGTDHKTKRRLKKPTRK